jgi:uncharacterized protein (TIGR03083 family)
MATTLAFGDHLAAIEAAGTRLVDLAVEAGMDTKVPTCPAWTTDALLAHQSMVHRWATAHVGGDDPDAVPTQTEIRTTVADLPAYYRDGLAGLLAALRSASPDLRAMTFLKDAPRPREFWARRQAHETTIHMVDALAATLGRRPSGGEAAIDAALAADGVDELVRGFFTRGRCKLFDGTPYTLAVETVDVPRRWVLRVDERLTVADGDGADEVATATVSGPAADVYLALWNRGGEVSIGGRPDVLDHWSASQRVTWS